MKRHAALAPLSRDHQHTLAVAQRLRRADAASAGEVSAAFLRLWELEERQHFRAEEEILLPLYAAHGDPEHALVRRALVDHVCIRRDARLLGAGDAPPALLHGLGERLAAHVRMEERELFPLIEAVVPERELEALATLLGEHA